MTGARLGAHAEVVAVRADRVVPKPPEVSHEDAAGVLFGGTTALHLLRDRVRPGHRVLVNGASGAIGTTPLGTLAGPYDVVLDTVGNVDVRGGRALLAPGGLLLLAVADLGQTLRARGEVVAGPAPERTQDYVHLLGLVASGDLRVVTRALPLDDIAEAHRVVDSGRKVGNLVVLP